MKATAKKAYPLFPFSLACLLLALLLSNCNTEDDAPPLQAFDFLPENLIATDATRDLIAQYTNPTTRYNHAVFGDEIEGGGLLVTINGKQYHHLLPETEVFEDLQPRLADVDGDGDLEFITIRSSVTEGASVAIYKIINEELVLMTASDFIGTKYRWLNIAAIADLDNDGKLDIAWVQTPHIGGILRIFTVENGALNFKAERSGVSNHVLNVKNLCLSIVTEVQNQKTLYVPTNEYDAVKGFQFIGNEIVEVSTIELMVDGAVPLHEQLSLTGRVEDASCIFAP